MKRRISANSFDAAHANLIAQNCLFLKGLLVPFKGKGGALLAQVQEADHVHQWCKWEVSKLVQEFKETFSEGRGFLPVTLQVQRAVSGGYVRWRRVGGSQAYVDLASETGSQLMEQLKPIVRNKILEINDRVMAINAVRSLAYHRHRTLDSWLKKRQQIDRIFVREN